MQHFEKVYPLLHRIASKAMKDGHGTLQPTALVHEAWIKLASSGAEFADRAHFVAVAATAIRQILVDHLRARKASRRGGPLASPVTLTGLRSPHVDPVELLAVDEVLVELKARDERQARVAELRIFGGLEHAEIAAVLGTSVSTVEREWRRARAWMAATLATRQGPAD